MPRALLKPKKTVHTNKRCPECYTELPLDAGACASCKRKVGKVNAYGIAKKPTNWLSYMMCFVSWSVFVMYMWWVF